ncbi:chorismate mutase [Streptomyces sp. NBC_01190]|uniref:chorismate mutase n=1 Tax=Streptomyces sp. NBC_01190 TaxID=2903767 RepID=UPI00386A93C7|nr:chorismate mutase [Streptomyces sp. NBC_01190]
MSETAAGSAIPTPGPAGVPDGEPEAAGTAGAAGAVRDTEPAGTAGSAGGAGGAEETDRLIAEKRRHIDDLDARIIALIEERVALSGEIQAARIDAGGRRLHLNREMEVLRTYGNAMGRCGTSLAMTLLELSRGRA